MMTHVQLTEKITGNVARSVNPLGLRAMMTQQMTAITNQGTYPGPRHVLVLGGSSSYGLASRLTATFGAGADTLSVGYDRPPQGESLGSAGWWNQVYFKQAAEQAGHIARNLNADVFSPATKRAVIEEIQTHFGGAIDLLVYSIAAPKRVNPVNPTEVWRSVIKPLGRAVTDATLDLEHEKLVSTTVPPATATELAATIHVMGGEDWELWVHALQAAGVLAPQFKTVLYSYEGPTAMAPIYHDGTLGQAKRAAEASAQRLQTLLAPSGGEALISVNRSVTTKASMVIPGFSRYCMALYQVEQATGGHEVPVQQIDRLMRQMIYGDHRELDARGRLRPDAAELSPAVQAQVMQLLPQITPATFTTDLPGYQQLRREFRQLNGFAVPGVTNTLADGDLQGLTY
ncbi:trans-2-enoyl-CoA reductase family protein [Levilactobacillus brevis]|uniref:trans-2-enoyl-CoA reductase family protein n=1 Tax=Levilactobacillus TaxID=2767886 RepID=UPI0012E763EE|nr:trans-2-enoyl-CoA reductase family protein [Levilactobacillus brevis]MCB5231476.1 trans-2-enoyl-CoA reductase family protein [Levilactobacillus brevis]MCS8596317.1 trans-2-enoyl-CoA reductase family protein [Levilactobacillus brevis]MCT3563892.1 trans-2-enoyl-CoA reductase family protein [Levilactobacillus brevis]MCX7511548.1 trans-2-enoyl-CoA reductase family protein [Levilactobacillus brevis]MUV40916.1 enoyl-[acyl-carrier-protein] reductase FabV [Levilactobacillus brevis]